MRHPYILILLLLLACSLCATAWFVKDFVNAHVCAGTIITDQKVNMFGPYNYTLTNGNYAFCVSDSNGNEATPKWQIIYRPYNLSFFIIKFLPDSKLFVTFQSFIDAEERNIWQNYTLEIWDIKTGALLQQRMFNSSIIQDYGLDQEISDDGAFLILGYNARYNNQTNDPALWSVEVLNTSTLETEKLWTENHFDSLTFSPDSKYLLLEFFKGGSGKIYSIPNFEEVVEFNWDKYTLGWIKKNQLFTVSYPSESSDVANYTALFTIYGNVRALTPTRFSGWIQRPIREG